jgi:Gpi18-like mannosyltransferase
VKQYANDQAYNTHGLPQFNHPPIPAYWAMIAYELTKNSTYTAHQDSVSAFPFVFRIPDILADALSCWLLYRIGSSRAGPRAGAILALAFAWSPCAILISAHHGSTDSIYAALCLLAVYCAAELDAPFLAGLALGAAINIKLIPVFLIPPMLAAYRSRRDLSRFFAGLAIMAIPFLPVLFAAGRDFAHYAMAYSSVKDYWGFNGCFLEIAHVAGFAAIGTHLVNIYTAVGRYLLAGCVVAFSILARRRRIDFFNATAGCAAIFLILTPGFGLQYLVFVLPILLAANFKAGLRYSLLSGMFLLIAYALFWDRKFPIQTYAVSGEVRRGFGTFFGFLAWISLIVFVVRLIATSCSRKDDSVSAAPPSPALST